jgi:hypothetical protein
VKAARESRGNADRVERARSAGEVTVSLRAFVFVVIAAAVLGAPARAADKPEDLAQAAAESWLKLTDAGDGAASWEQAAKVFKNALGKEQWSRMLAGVRPPLGKVVSRKLASRQYGDNIAGAPAGKYVTIQYETVFENKSSAVETVTPMLDPDGVWRVSGYFIR